VRKRHGNCAAFTLYELVISLALFAVVAGLVITFISFIQRFNVRNNAYTARVEQVTSLRTQIDRWFSCFDDAVYTLTLSESGAVITASAESTRYAITSSAMEEGIKVTFSYPQTDSQESDPLTVEVECPNLESVFFRKIIDDSAVSEESEEDYSLRFIIDLHVATQTNSTGRYACEITYRS